MAHARFDAGRSDPSEVAWLALIISAIAFFAVGTHKAWTTGGHPGRSGLETAAIGIVSALIGDAVGLLFVCLLASR